MTSAFLVDTSAQQGGTQLLRKNMRLLQLKGWFADHRAEKLLEPLRLRRAELVRKWATSYHARSRAFP